MGFYGFSGDIITQKWEYATIKLLKRDKKRKFFWFYENQNCFYLIMSYNLGRRESEIDFTYNR